MLAETQRAIESARSAAADKVTGLIMEPLDASSSSLGALHQELALMSRRVDEEQERLRVLRERVNSGITIAAVVATLVCLWMAVAQAGLFVHGYEMLTGRDLLARWRALETVPVTKDALVPPMSQAAESGPPEQDL